MTKAQGKLLALFKEIDEICKRHDIIYYMAGGTLIGAVRHKGFIPWDDDMDILMSRANFEKFLEVIKTEMPKDRVMACQELDRDYPNMIARYTDINSTAIHKSQILGDGICGYVVDILVLDPIPDGRETYDKYKRDIMLYSDLINPFLNYSYRWGYNKDRFHKYYKRMMKEGKEKVLSEIESGIFCFDEKECDYYAMRWGGCPFLFEKDMYGSSRWGEFEGIKVRIPDRTGDYLTWHYGDEWMDIPPHNEHESHEAIFSFTTDYKTIMNDYMDFINIKKTRRAMMKRKEFFLKHMNERLMLKYDEAKVVALGAEIELTNKIDMIGEDLDNLLKQERYEELSDIFESYYSSQFSRKLIGREDYQGISRFYRPLFIEICDEILYVALMTLVHTKRISKAVRLLEVRKWVKGDICDSLISVEELIRDIRSAVSDEDLGREEEAFKKCLKLYDRYPKNKSISMLMSRLMLKKGEYEKAKEIIRKAIEYFPEDGYFYKYLGDCYYRENKEKAYELYYKALPLTENGLVILEIEGIVEKDKEELTKIISEKKDADFAARIMKLSPNDIDFREIFYNILIERSSAEELKTVIENLKNDLIEFEHSEVIKRLLAKAYMQAGSKSDCASIRVDIICASAIEEYKKIKSVLEILVENNPEEKEYLELLRDSRACIGLTREG